MFLPNKLYGQSLRPCSLSIRAVTRPWGTQCSEDAAGETSVPSDSKCDLLCGPLCSANTASDGAGPVLHLWPTGIPMVRTMQINMRRKVGAHHTHTEHIHLLYPKHSNWFKHLMLCDVWTQCICCSWPNTNHSYTHTVWNVLAVLCLLNIISYQPVGNHFTHVFTNWAVLVKTENVHHKRDDIIW